MNDDHRSDSTAEFIRHQRDAVLRDLTHYVSEAWASFEHPRPHEPETKPSLIDRLNDSLPIDPVDIDIALADAVSVLESSISPARPLYLAYVGSTGLETSVLASTLLATYDANLATAAGAADLLDRQAVRWVAEFVGYPAVDGHFTSGGQTSNLTAILAAREAALPGTREYGVAEARATVYCSDEAHHSVVRAVEAAGLGRNSLRRIPIDESRRMRVDVLAEHIERDLADGFTPVAVVATAGSTLTGTIDPLDAIADVCQRFGVWMHVDGAYGAPAAATATARNRFTGLDRADSLTIDAHKWLGMQKSCSVILVTRHGALRAAFGHEERYMLHEDDTGNPVDSTFEYSRPFRSIKVWLSFRVHGAERFRRWIDGTIRLAERFAEAVRVDPDFELLHDPMLSTICFRHAPPDLDAEKLDDHNERLARAIQRDGRVYLAPATIDGMTCLRVCFVNFRTTTDDVDSVLPIIREIGSRP